MEVFGPTKTTVSVLCVLIGASCAPADDLSGVPIAVRRLVTVYRIIRFNRNISVMRRVATMYLRAARYLLYKSRV
jgi:hypothetical protein